MFLCSCCQFVTQVHPSHPPPHVCVCFGLCHYFLLDLNLLFEAVLLEKLVLLLAILVFFWFSLLVLLFIRISNTCCIYVHISLPYTGTLYGHHLSFLTHQQTLEILSYQFIILFSFPPCVSALACLIQMCEFIQAGMSTWGVANHLLNVMQAEL